MDRSPAASRSRRPRSRPDAAAARPAPKPAARGSELRTDLVAILLCLLGALAALGLFRPGSAGTVGTALVHVLRFWSGHVSIVAPVFFVGAGILLALDYRRATNPQLVLGAGGLLVLLFGWVHLMTTPAPEVWHTTGARLSAVLGWRYDPELLAVPDGGLFGAFVMTLLLPLGRMGTYVTLVAVGLASVLMITELTLRTIMERVHERSRIAAERARRHAGTVGARCREAAAALPARRQRLFLDLDHEDGEAPAETKPGPRALSRTAQAAPRKSPRRAVGEDAALPAPAAPPALPLEAVAAPRPSAPAAAPRTESQSQAAGESRAAKPAFRPVRARASRGAADGTYLLPPAELLDPPSPRMKRSAADTEAHIAILENTLGQFRIQAQVVEIADGPSVTRYEVRLGEGIRVKKILDLADNIAMSLAAMSVRVEAPIPGKAAIGIEVPKKHPCIVSLRECLEAPEFRDLKSRVGFVLGKDVAGEVRCADLARMPHLLVAGATNSGKSVCLNVLIASMLFRARPDELKMIMIDPKRVELTLFDGIPHLIHPVVKDVKQAAGILRWVLKEMDRRYDLFAHLMTRNIENYNEKVVAEPEKRLPFIVVVIDELADLMMQQGPEVEQSICRLAQLARATGIHLVVATQRPSVDVITGLIKANVPSRISFAVTSQIDSRTILDGKGAESLVGRGDMLFKPVDAAKPVRIQGAFLRESEVERLVEYLRTQGSPEYLAEALAVDHGAYGKASEEEVEDDMFEPAARFVVTTGHASTSMIQRKFKIGYTRAARLVDMMEARGIVSALDGARPRDIQMSRDALDQMFRDTRDSLFRRDLSGRDAPSDPGDEEESLVEMEETIPSIGPSTGGDPFLDA